MKFIVNYWYVPILVLIFLTGIILTIKLKGVQFRRLGKGLKLMLKSSNNEEGEISTFQALAKSNLNEANPPFIVKWFRYSHPPLVDRITNLENEIREKHD